MNALQILLKAIAISNFRLKIADFSEITKSILPPQCSFHC